MSLSAEGMNNRTLVVGWNGCKDETMTDNYEYRIVGIQKANGGRRVVDENSHCSLTRRCIYILSLSSISIFGPPPFHAFQRAPS